MLIDSGDKLINMSSVWLCSLIYMLMGYILTVCNLWCHVCFSALSIHIANRFKSLIFIFLFQQPLYVYIVEYLYYLTWNFTTFCTMKVLAQRGLVSCVSAIGSRRCLSRTVAILTHSHNVYEIEGRRKKMSILLQSHFISYEPSDYNAYLYRLLVIQVTTQNKLLTT
jgi:hypothetical protein